MQPLTRVEGRDVLALTKLHAGGGEVKLFSALKKQGLDEVAQLLWDWSHPPASGADVTEPLGDL